MHSDSMFKPLRVSEETAVIFLPANIGEAETKAFQKELGVALASVFKSPVPLQIVKGGDGVTMLRYERSAMPRPSGNAA